MFFLITNSSFCKSKTFPIAIPGETPVPKIILKTPSYSSPNLLSIKIDMQAQDFFMSLHIYIHRKLVNIRLDTKSILFHLPSMSIASTL